MDQCILDSSVGAKWIFEEDQQERALQLLHQIEKGRLKVVVPELFYLEMANIAWKRVWKKGGDLESVTESLDRILDLRLIKYPDHELADAAFENAVWLNVTAYDGAYLALAEIYVSPLVTADKKLLEACRGKFVFIESLEAFT